MFQTSTLRVLWQQIPPGNNILGYSSKFESDINYTPTTKQVPNKLMTASFFDPPTDRHVPVDQKNGYLNTVKLSLHEIHCNLVSLFRLCV